MVLRQFESKALSNGWFGHPSASDEKQNSPIDEKGIEIPSADLTRLGNVYIWGFHKQVE